MSVCTMVLLTFIGVTFLVICKGIELLTNGSGYSSSSTDSSSTSGSPSYGYDGTSDQSGTCFQLKAYVLVLLSYDISDSRVSDQIEIIVEYIEAGNFPDLIKSGIIETSAIYAHYALAIDQGRSADAANYAAQYKQSVGNFYDTVLWNCIT